MMTTSSNHSLQISDSQFYNAIEQLRDFVAIPSISNRNNAEYHLEHLDEAARFVIRKLEELSFDTQVTQIQDSPLYISGEKLVNRKNPTVVLYAHYDVQPVDRDKWETDPFVMTERDGRLYGRGTSDDKGGIIAILTALQFFKESKRPLPVNVKVLFEGEEEYGSSHMKNFLRQESEVVEGDALIVLDGANREKQTGTLLSSTRGLVNLALSVKALKKPIHSGIGCLAPDPAQALAALIHSLIDARKIPGFMDGSQTLKEEEKELFRKSSITSEKYKKEIGLVESATLRGDPSESVYERILQEPSISIVNMNCGKPNGGNSIQDEANCTIGIRITPGQDPEHIADVVTKYLKEQPVLGNLSLEIEKQDCAWGWKANLSGPLTNKYLESLKENFSDVCAMPCGGALPLLKDFEEFFPDMEMIVPGVEDEDTAAHSHNESQDLAVLRNSINSLIAFLDKAGSQQFPLKFQVASY